MLFAMKNCVDSNVILLWKATLHLRCVLRLLIGSIRLACSS